MSTPKAHAKFAASSSKRWTSCISSLKRIEKSPPQEENKAASEGTKAHELMELCLVNGHDVGFYAMHVNDDLELEYPLEMRVRVQGFLDYVRGELAKYPSGRLHVEKRVHLKNLHPTEAFGTVDVYIVEDFGVLHIIDYKDGFEWVGHIDNTQMIYYALGVCYEEGFDFGEIKTTIYQPKTGKKDEEYVPRTDTFDVQKLFRYEHFFKTKIEEEKKATEDSHLEAGDHCRWCPAKMNCPALTKSAFEKAQLDFADSIQPDPKFLTSDQIKTLLDKSAYLKLWIKEVETYAENQIRAGKKVDGWAIVPTRAQRVWRDVDSLLKWDHKRMTGINQFLKSNELISPAQAEKVLKKKLSKEDLEEFMNDNVVSVSSGDKLTQTNQNYDGARLDDYAVELKGT